MVYRFVGLQNKVSSKGNNYACLNVVDLNGISMESFIFEPILSEIKKFNLEFGDYVDIECNLKGIISIFPVEGAYSENGDRM